jgi:hypothetical protein
MPNPSEREIRETIHKALTESLQQISRNGHATHDNPPYSTNFSSVRHPDGYWVEKGWEEGENADYAAHLKLARSGLHFMKINHHPKRSWTAEIGPFGDYADAFGYTCSKAGLRTFEYDDNAKFILEITQLDREYPRFYKSMLVTTIASPRFHSRSFWDVSGEMPVRLQNKNLGLGRFKVTLTPISQNTPGS